MKTRNMILSALLAEWNTCGKLISIGDSSFKIVKPFIYLVKCNQCVLRGEMQIRRDISAGPIFHYRDSLAPNCFQWQQRASFTKH